MMLIVMASTHPKIVTIVTVLCPSGQQYFHRAPQSNKNDTNIDDADCDGVNTSEDCNDTDATVVNSNVDDADCDGINTFEDCNDDDSDDTMLSPTQISMMPTVMASTHLKMTMPSPTQMT